ncbi:hypothetical protein SAMN04488095_2286 [Jannaschia pohangensis]|uniref:Uncharacterized protein n=1 Tax=Jannaschia pohangensis TaxID=390807 RepID=A0A1I3NZC5_9RHOB|nr:hypothetical protein SAMN04488095_2286 [Jannaschia pohangensis]
MARPHPLEASDVAGTRYGHLFAPVVQRHAHPIRALSQDVMPNPALSIGPIGSHQASPGSARRSGGRSHKLWRPHQLARPIPSRRSHRLCVCALGAVEMQILPVGGSIAGGLAVDRRVVRPNSRAILAKAPRAGVLRLIRRRSSIPACTCAIVIFNLVRRIEDMSQARMAGPAATAGLPEPRYVNDVLTEATAAADGLPSGVGLPFWG